MQDRQRTLSWHRRLWIAAAILCGAGLALLAAIVVLAPKAINSGEVRARIEAVIAKELNGTFTYDRVELALLPRPVVVLYKVAIDLPGTLSATVDTVRVHARLFPLFRGRFAISSIALERPEISLTLTDEDPGRSTRKPMKKQAGGASFDTALTIASRELPELSIKVTRGKIGLLRDSRPFLSLGDLDASFAFLQTGQGPAAYHVTGMAKATVSGIASLPAPLSVSIEQFDATPGTVTVKSAKTRIQDLTASLSASFTDYLKRSPRSEIQARGTIGPEALAWLQTLAGLPDAVKLSAPLTFTGARLRSTGTGSDVTRALTITVAKEGLTSLDLAMRHGPGKFSIDNLHVKDSDSDAVVKFSSGPEEVTASFSGNLSGTTIDRLVERGKPTSGWLKGDLQARMPRGLWAETSVHGTLVGEQLDLPALNALPIAIARFAVLADGATINVNTFALSLGQDALQMNGTASFREGGVALAMDVTADRLSWQTLRSVVEQKPRERPGTDAQYTPRLSGDIHLRTAVFSMDRYQAESVDMRIGFGKGRTEVALDHASICGITLTGSLQSAGSEVLAGLTPQARGMQLAESVPCLFHENLGTSGTFDLSAQFTSIGTWETLLRSTTGKIALVASNGRIQSDHVVKGVIAYLNSTSLLKGSHDVLVKEGVPFEKISIRSTLRDGTLSLSEAVIKSRDLNIAAEGIIGLRDGTLALNVLAAPFTRLDRFLGNIPLVKSLVGNALVVVPARVEGTFDRPTVRPQPVSGVGKDVTNLMKNTLKAPMQIIDPVLPKGLDGKEARPQE